MEMVSKEYLLKAFGAFNDEERAPQNEPPQNEPPQNEPPQLNGRSVKGSETSSKDWGRKGKAMEFKEFCETIKSGIESGAIKTDRPLTEFEMAVQFAVCSIGVRKGYPCETTLEEIRLEIEQFAPELLEEGEEA